MLRARLSNGTFLFGIDAENLRRLTSGMPLHVDMKGMGGHDRFIIVYGDTLEDIQRDLEVASGKPLPPAQPWKAYESDN
jgi:hypothetical protein